MALTQMLVMPLFVRSGALYRLRSLPAWLSVLTRLGPIAYVVYPVRQAVCVSSAVGARPGPSRSTDGRYQLECRPASLR